MAEVPVEIRRMGWADSSEGSVDEECIRQGMDKDAGWLLLAVLANPSLGRMMGFKGAWGSVRRGVKTPGPQ